MKSQLKKIAKLYGKSTTQARVSLVGSGFTKKETPKPATVIVLEEGESLD